MGRQLIISVSREYGSGGRVIAEKIAKDLGLPLYARNILDEIARERGVSVEHLRECDEKPKNPFLSRRVRGYSNSMEEVVAELQFQYLRDKAASGESFVVVGRCSEWALREYPGLITFFVIGDWEKRIQRIMEVYHLGRTAAVNQTRRHDLYRKTYHNMHCDFKWGHPHGYDLMVNSSRLGIDGTTELLKAYISQRKAERQL